MPSPIVLRAIAFLRSRGYTIIATFVGKPKTGRRKVRKKKVILTARKAVEKTLLAIASKKTANIAAIETAKIVTRVAISRKLSLRPKHIIKGISKKLENVFIGNIIGQIKRSAVGSISSRKIASSGVKILLDTVVSKRFKVRPKHIFKEISRTLEGRLVTKVNKLIRKHVTPRFGEREIATLFRSFGLTPGNKFQVRSIFRRQEHLKRLDTILRQKYGSEAAFVMEKVGKKVEHALLKKAHDLAGGKTTIKFASKELRLTVRELGILPGSSFQFETIFRTQSQAANSDGKFAADELNDEIWGYKYVTKDDGRVRPNHYLQHGVVAEKNDPFWKKWWTPNGHGCRCKIITLYQRPVGTLKKPVLDVEPDPGFENTREKV